MVILFWQDSETCCWDYCHTEWKNLFANKNNSWVLVQNQIFDAFERDFSHQLFDNSSIRYIVIPLKNLNQSEDFFQYYGWETDVNIRDWYIARVEQIPWLTPIDIGMQEVRIYENKGYKPKIYLTHQIESIFEEVPPSLVDWKMIHPTQYTLHLKGIIWKQYLNFSELYHPDWHIRVGDFDWFHSLWNWAYFLDETFHSKSNANLNSFIIDVDSIKNNSPRESYRQNPDGSIDVDITIYFHPQSYFILGSIISCFTLLILLIYCISYYRKSSNHTY